MLNFNRAVPGSVPISKIMRTSVDKRMLNDINYAAQYKLDNLREEQIVNMKKRGNKILVLVLPTMARALRL